MNEDLSPFKNIKVAAARGVLNRRSCGLSRFKSGSYCLEVYFDKSPLAAFHLKKIEHVFKMIEMYYSGTCDTYELLRNEQRKLV